MKNLLKSGGHGGGLGWEGIKLIKNGIETRLICEKCVALVEEWKRRLHNSQLYGVP